MTTVFDRLWAESKIAHIAHARATAHKFPRRLQKFSLAALFVEENREERAKIRSRANGVLEQYVPQILSAIDLWEEGFDQWEEENSGSSRCGTPNALQKQDEGMESTHDLSAMMIGKLWSIRGYGRYFHLIESPARMVHSLYPGRISTEKARNYCEFLLQVFA